jgi:kinesin family protein 12
MTSSNELTVTTPSGGSQSIIANGNNPNNNGDNETSFVRSFQFDRVFHADTTQQQIFEVSGIKDLVDSALSGYSTTVFGNHFSSFAHPVAPRLCSPYVCWCWLAYGQTGSGKTFTMSGLEERIVSSGYSKTMHTDGLIPRCLSYLFSVIRQRNEASSNRDKYAVRGSCLEIYNEVSIYSSMYYSFELMNWVVKQTLRDLLNPSGTGLSLRQSTVPTGTTSTNTNSSNGSTNRGSFFVENLLVVDCTTPDDLMAVAAEGHRNRHVGSHELNQDSSRSHSIMTVYLDWTHTDGTSSSGRHNNDSESLTVRRCGKIHFVDLAGSENLKQSKSTGQGAKETGSINRSLFCLGTVIATLGDISLGRKPRGTHIPYRDSMLTKLLMDSLGGEALTMMIACLSPSIDHVDESTRTLLYATRARNIKNRPSIQVNTKDEMIYQLRQEVRQLRHENNILRQTITNAGLAIPNIPLQNGASPSIPSSTTLSMPASGVGASPMFGRRAASATNSSGNGNDGKASAVSPPPQPGFDDGYGGAMTIGDLGMYGGSVDLSTSATPSDRDAFIRVIFPPVERHIRLFVDLLCLIDLGRE